jgi:histidinol-phosphate aminotransferase
MKIPVRKTVLDIQPYTAGKKKAGCIKLSSNENPYGSSPKALEAAAESLEETYIYPDKNSMAIKKQLADHLDLNADDFIIGNGSDEIFVMAAGAFCEPDEKVITAGSTFSTYAFAASLFGGKTLTVPLREGKFDLQRILKVADDKTRIVFICNPNNPTGTYVSMNELKNFMEALPKNILVIIDEAYAEFADADDFPKPKDLLQYENILITRTFSKLYGLAGFRIGYGFSLSAGIIDALNRTKQPFNINIPAERAACAALSDSEFVMETLHNNREQKTVLYDFLDSAACTYYPSQSNFICIKTPLGSQKTASLMEDQGLTIRPLLSFGMPEWIRVTIGTPEQNGLFMKVFREVMGK